MAVVVVVLLLCVLSFCVCCRFVFVVVVIVCCCCCCVVLSCCGCGFGLRRTGLRRTAQNFALFLPFPATVLLFFVSLGVFSLNSGGQRTPDVTFERRFKTPPKFHEKTPRERERERNGGRKGEKKREILGPHPSGPRHSRPRPTLRGRFGQSRPIRMTKVGLAKVGRSHPTPRFFFQISNFELQVGTLKSGFKVRCSNFEVGTLKFGVKVHTSNFEVGTLEFGFKVRSSNFEVRSQTSMCQLRTSKVGTSKSGFKVQTWEHLWELHGRAHPL